MGKRLKKHLWLFLFPGILLVPESAQANIGVPMIAVTLPWMVIALVPVILVEGLILARRHELPFSRAAKAMSIANLITTFIGIPITWFLLVLVQMFTGGGSSYGIETAMDRFLAVTWQAPWLIPYESEIYWMVPAAFLVLSLPFFLSSWVLETFVLRKAFKEIPAPLLTRSALFANLASYFLIDLVVVLIFSLRH